MSDTLTREQFVTRLEYVKQHLRHLSSPDTQYLDSLLIAFDALRDRLAQAELLWKAAQVEVEKWGSKYRDLEAQLATAQARGKQLEAELQQVRSWLEPSEGA